MKVFWAPIFHIYQPFIQNEEMLLRVDRECYKPLLNLINDYDEIHINLNITGVLIESLYKSGLSDTMELLKNLVNENKIELLGSAKFHPILPLIPEKEIKRQILMNEEILSKEFDSWEKKGFFPPELAINSKLIEIIKDLGYKWVIMSGTACQKELSQSFIYKSSNDLQLFFRDESLSNQIAFNHINATDFVKELKNFSKTKDNKTNDNLYLITAMDGETFGHHIQNHEKKFLKTVFDLLNDENIDLEFVSQLDKHFPVIKNPVPPKNSSWSTTNQDLKDKIPYPLWNNPKNNIHQYFWKIVKNLNSLLDILENVNISDNIEFENYSNGARWYYDRGIASDSLWWANPKRYLWSPNLFYDGLVLLIKASINAQMALIYSDNYQLGENHFDSISYYHGLLLTELSKKAIQDSNQNKKSKKE